MAENAKIQTVFVDCADKIGPLNPIWRSFGYDEINWTYTPRGKRVFHEISRLSPAPYYIRCHHALTSGNGLAVPTQGSGNVLRHDDKGRLRYDFSLLDQVYDTFLQNNCKPIVELGFMPDVLSSARKPGPTYDYSRSDLWAYPPKDYQKWQELVYQTVKHCAEKYGAAEVNTWYWELWNEPDFSGFYKGSAREYCKLYDYTVAGATKALPSIKIGGPALASNSKFLNKFLRHCSRGKNYVTGERGTRLDFISFHAKGNGWPLPDNPFKMPSLSTIFSSLERYYSILREYPQYQNLDHLFDECDMAVATNFGVYDFPELKFNNTEYYPTFIVRMAKYIMDYITQKKLPIKFFTTWAFYFEGKRCFEGNRALFTNEDIKKPVFNAFVMLELLGETRVKLQADASVSHTKTFDSFPQIDGLATVHNNNSVKIIIWNFDEDQEKSSHATVKLEAANLPLPSKTAVIRRYQIDSVHSNSHTVWQKAGAPQDPSFEQINAIKLKEDLEVVESHTEVEIIDGKLDIILELPLHSVCLLEIDPHIC